MSAKDARLRSLAPARSAAAARAAEVENAIARANAAAAKAAGLLYTSDAAPGIRRRRRGTSFAYVDAEGARVRDRATLARIRKLVIPPAYTEVWICPEPRGHLQATGRDARGRKQYRYHAKWREVRDDDKYGRLVALGERLPRLRRILRRDLRLAGLPREKVVAIAVSILLDAALRVGNESYARENGSYGLTTLRARHIAFARAGRAVLAFRGKSGQRQEIRIDDARLVRLLRRCHRLPGQMLFQYLDDDGARHPIDSGAVNAYLADALGGEFTAKDIRTWTGTLKAVERLAGVPAPEPADEHGAKAALAAMVREVAAHLHNTPAVCRNSYIHPAVAEAWREGRLGRIAGSARGPRQFEAATLRLLRGARRRARRGSVHVGPERRR